MTYYSIGGIDITLEELATEGGRCWGGERLYGVHNCEWSAELMVRSGYRGPLQALLELRPRFRAGNREKFAADLPRIGPLLCAALAAQGASVIVHRPDLA